MGIRCFIAVELSEPVRAAIAGAVEDLRQSGADVRWVNTENIHITLKFLGDTEEALLPDIRQRLAKKLFNYKPFCIKITGVGSFPAGRHPRVIWIGLGESAALKALQADVESEMRAIGCPAEERPFAAHITVGRVKSGRRLPELTGKLTDMREVAFGDLEVRGVKVMKSELGRGGPVYTCLAEIPLNNS